MGTNKKHPYRLASLLAVGAISLLVVGADGQSPSEQRAVPTTEFRAFALAPQRMDPVEATAPSPPPTVPDAVVVDPLPVAPKPVPDPRPRQQREPRPRSAPLDPPRHAPRTSPGDVVRGVATWYCWPSYPSRCTVGFSSGGAYAAAGPELRRALGHWRGRFVFVNGVRVQLIDWCACGGNHVIDVYHSTWVRIPNQSHVKITW